MALAKARWFVLASLAKAPRLAAVAQGRLLAVATLALTLATLAGCGSNSGGLPAKALKPGESEAQRKLQRADLAIVSHGLLGAEQSIRREIAASKSAWPAVVHGLPPRLSPTERAAITIATLRTQQIATPRFISYAGELTGAAAAIAGLLLSYEGLVQRGWSFTLTAAHAGGVATESSLAGSPSGNSSADISPSGGSSTGSPSAGGPSADGPSGGGSATGGSPTGTSSSLRTLNRQLASASPSAVRFLRANANLYIGCVYDGHYNLSTIGEDLLQAYNRLGGAASFGATLRAEEVAAIAHFYSLPNARLAPRPPTSPTGS